MRKDIFADFLSPDNRFIYGTYANISEQIHEKILGTSLNISILLAGENLIVPPFFPFQCKIALRALAYKYEFIDEGYIIFPMRESTLELFLEKKKIEYSQVKDVYTGIYKGDGRSFLINRTPKLIKRNIKMGATIAKEWQSAPDSAISWEPIKNDLSGKEIEKIRNIPFNLKENGSAVTWAAMKEFLIKYKVLDLSIIKALGTKLDEAIQFEYIKAYLNEFNATVITRIPPKSTDIFISGDNLSYDYWMFYQVMKLLGIWETIANATAKEVVQIKNSFGFIIFMQVFEQVCIILNSKKEILELYAEVVSQAQLKKHSILDNNFLRNLLPLNIKFLNDLFLELSRNILVYSDNNFKTDFNFNKNQKCKRKIKMGKIFLVHGKNVNVRNEILVFLNSLHLEVEVMEINPSATRTLPEKFESIASECDYAVVIATADDIIYINGEEKRRVRQNVLIEIGYFWGRLGRKEGQWCLLLEHVDNLEIPTDIQGLGFIPITPDLGQTKLRLKQELEAAGVI